MHGGSKSKANFYGTKPFGGPVRLLLSFYLPAACFGFYSLRLRQVTQVQLRRSSLTCRLKGLVWRRPCLLPCFSRDAQRLIYSKLYAQVDLTQTSPHNHFEMYPGKQSWSQNLPQSGKIEEEKPIRYQDVVTAVKRSEQMPIYTQETPRPQKKIMLFDQDRRRQFFPLVRDREVGMGSKFQNLVIESYNDDDKQTSSTQMRAGMAQTIQDLYGEIEWDQKGPQ